MTVRRVFRPIKPKRLPSSTAIVAALKGALRDATADGVRFIAWYPPVPTGQVYIRTGTLGRSWSISVPALRGGNRIEAIIKSSSGIAPYNKKVQGEGQDPFFTRRGWRNTNDLLVYVEGVLPNLVKQALDRTFT